MPCDEMGWKFVHAHAQRPNPILQGTMNYDSSELPAARCVHSIAFALTASAPSSSPSRRSSSSHFLKNDLQHQLPTSQQAILQCYILRFVTCHFEGQRTVKEVPVRLHSASCDREGSEDPYLRLLISPWPASISMYIDHISHRLGCESTMPSKMVFPRSGSPSLYSSCANLQIVFKSIEGRCWAHDNIEQVYSTHVSVSLDSGDCEVKACGLLRAFPS